MNRWKNTLVIKHLLTGSDDPAVAKKTAQQIATVLRGSSWWKQDTVEHERRTAGDQIPVPSSLLQTCAESLDNVNSVEQLNITLDLLYDLADTDRVWVE